MPNLSYFFVLDQLRVSNALVGWQAWRDSFPKAFALESTILECGYVPAVTPVGHATLSTGEYPSTHGVGGRRWVVRQSAGEQGESRSIDRLTEVFEQTNGALDIVGPSGGPEPARLPKGVEASIQYLLFNSICSILPADVFTIVVSAKDFVSVLLGGYHADIVIYPVVGQPLPGQYTEWVIRVYCSPRRHFARGRVSRAFGGLLSPPLPDQVVDAIRQMLAQVRIDGKPLPDLARLQSRVVHRGWVAEGFHEFVLPFTREIQRSPENNLLIDKMYSAIANCIVEEYQKIYSDVAVFQSMYSPDVTAHMTGTRQEYQSIVTGALTHIRDLLEYHINKKTVYVDINCCITSDHGGRDTPRKSPLTANPGHPDVFLPPQVPLPVVGGTTLWYQEDGLFCFPDAKILPGDEKTVTVLVDTERGLLYWQLPLQVVRRSFQGVPPRYLLAPVPDQILIRPRGTGFFGDGGSHGLGVYFPIHEQSPNPAGGQPLQQSPTLVTEAGGTIIGDTTWDLMGRVANTISANEWQLNPVEQYVPGIFITTKNLRYFRDWVARTTLQTDVRDLFVRVATA